MRDQKKQHRDKWIRYNFLGVNINKDKVSALQLQLFRRQDWVGLTFIALESSAPLSFYSAGVQL